MCRCTRSRAPLFAPVLGPLLVAVAHAPAQEIRDLGLLQGGIYAEGWVMNADGSVVAGNADTTVGGSRHSRGFRCAPPGVLVSVGVLAGDFSSIATCITGNGQFVYGISTGSVTTRAYKWSFQTGIVELPIPEGFGRTEVYGVSADGSVAAGMVTYTEGGRYIPIRWTPTGPELLDRLIDGGDGRVMAVSGDGRVCAGHSWAAVRPPGTNGVGTRWDGTAASEVAPDTFPRAINHNGTVIVGNLAPATGGSLPFRWTVDSGLTILPLPAGFTRGTAYGVSADGSMVVGQAQDSGPPATQTAFLWTEETGTVDLNQWLPTQGVDLGDWTLLGAQAVVNDGCRLAITGTGGLPGTSRRAYRICFCTEQDRDGDALCDDWEINGIPYFDADGNPQRYILDADGDGITDASPTRKDIFIEVDAMAGRAPNPAALAMVVLAFNDAPVPAPNIPGGEDGISLHIVRDDQALPFRPYPSPWAEFNADKDAYFGTAAERAGASWAQMKEAKAKAYRYGIFADTINNSTTSGVAEGIICDDFIVSLGALNGDGTPVWPNESGQPGGTVEMQAGTFMHELGHALGLRHGGGDNIAYKPNYYSIMNYIWQFPRPFNPIWELRFSDTIPPPLHESALDESAGCGLNLPARVFPFTIDPGVGGCTGMFTCQSLDPMTGAVDWNINFTTDPDPVSVNLNTGFPDGTQFNGPLGQTLHGHDDWANLVYNFRGSPHYAPGAAAADIGREMDQEIADYLETFATGSCPADWNDDALVNSNDISAFLTSWLDSVQNGNLIADFNGDMTVNSNDISAFLTAWLDAVQNGC